MKAFLLEGYLDAVTGLWAAVKLFWPFLVLFAISIGTLVTVGNFRVTTNFDTAPWATLVIVVGMLALFAYFFVLLCKGAVGWHRRLLLGERAQWLSPIPSRRSLQYALPAILFVFVMWAALAVVTFTVLPRLLTWFAASLQGLNLTPNPTIEELENFRRAVIPINLSIQALMMLIVGAVVWGGRSWLLAFPHVAVRSRLPVWGVLKRIVPMPSGFIGALLVTMFLPSILGTLYQSFMPMSMQIMPWVATTASLVSIPLAILSLLSGLSILSIAYRRAGIDQIPYEERDHAVQS